jgi:hypothetical protein
VRTEQTGERGQTAWSDIDWATTEAAVRRLQDRIYRAAAAGNGRQVKNLQKFLVRSLSAKRLAVRRVTQQNAGRNTPGVDGVVCRTPESRTRLTADLNLKGYRSQPVRRVYIPKSDGRTRPLGIPHAKVQGKRTPLNPDDRGYWELRRRRRLADTPRSPRRLALLRRQDYRCALCGAWFDPDEDIPLIDEHHDTPRHRGGTDQLDNLQLVHRWCHHAHHARTGYRAAEA